MERVAGARAGASSRGPARVLRRRLTRGSETCQAASGSTNRGKRRVAVDGTAGVMSYVDAERPEAGAGTARERCSCTGLDPSFGPGVQVLSHRLAGAVRSADSQPSRRMSDGQAGKAAIIESLPFILDPIGRASDVVGPSRSREALVLHSRCHLYVYVDAVAVWPADLRRDAAQLSRPLRWCLPRRQSHSPSVRRRHRLVDAPG